MFFSRCARPVTHELQRAALEDATKVESNGTAVPQINLNAVGEGAHIGFIVQYLVWLLMFITFGFDQRKLVNSYHKSTRLWGIDPRRVPWPLSTPKSQPVLIPPCWPKLLLRTRRRSSR